MFNEATGQQQLWRIDFHLRKYGRPVEDHGVIASESDAEEDDREGGEGHGELGGGEGLLQRLVGRFFFNLGAQSDLLNLKIYSLVSWASQF